MKNDILNQLWNSGKNPSALVQPEALIKKAKSQRQLQYIGITVLSVTVLILIIYAVLFFPKHFNNFSLGLLLMIIPLVFRIALEIGSIYKKQSKITEMDSKAYHNYLKRYYNFRKVVNYAITPVCFGIYVYGLTLLFPYFKSEFSNGFYTYLVVSGIISLLVIAFIIVRGILKENRFYKEVLKK